MAEELIAVPASRPGGRASPRLEAILIADAARERARRARDKLIGLLAALGAPLWLAASWPTHVSDELRLLAATLWAVVGGAVLVAMARVWWWNRLRAGRVAALGPLPTLRSACAETADEED